MILLHLDGRASAGPANRKDLIARMAADLCRVGIPADEHDAIRTLCALNYRYGDVAVLAEDALLEARQAAVSEAMATKTPPFPTLAKASQAPLPQTVLAAPGSKNSGLLSMLALEAPLCWRDPGAGA
ncbi:hypothetical protein [Bradyrhizobium liaoningense]|uniref:hypothetical protein n=1 Tax=Bradyrhizobium liaoningense TaxID=43992 RepID=UPI0004B4833C|nr:hypothetical protein [Bradyrhizobium liaoningense]GLR92837.1 hypothetical protein GCM10007858_04590 [Bradyrhizobium liaoningense]